MIFCIFVNLLGESVVILDTRLAVRRIFVEFDELHVVHRVGLLDVRAEVEMVELVVVIVMYSTY